MAAQHHHFVFPVTAGNLGGAQEKLNADINARIRQEEAAHSQILRTLHYFTDVYGSRCPLLKPQLSIVLIAHSPAAFRFGDPVTRGP